MKTAARGGRKWWRWVVLASPDSVGVSRLFGCLVSPSAAVSSWRPSADSDPGLPTSNYVASAGTYGPEETCSAPGETVCVNGRPPPDGVFFGMTGTAGIAIRQIPDGLSKTILAGERCGAISKDQAETASGSVAAVWAGNGRSSGGTGKRGAARCYGRMAFPINEFFGEDSNPKGYSSFHSGGAQFLFGDGSSAFVSESVDQAILMKMGKRDEGFPMPGIPEGTPDRPL